MQSLSEWCSSEFSRIRSSLAEDDVSDLNVRVEKHMRLTMEAYKLYMVAKVDDPGSELCGQVWASFLKQMADGEVLLQQRNSSDQS